ncbi:MAG TPA: cupredoxin family copper-binding protein [Steroidobacteraceae bacterium]|nr:cupredoxin family copper-binding protein [Steroidobacteraceae bacterium]
MRTSGVLMLVGALLSLGGSVGAATEPAAPATQHSVVIENMQFNPPQLTVHRGDRIVWVNKDLFPHTVTSVNKKFDSGSIAAGSSWSWVARSSGEFAYGCTFHPTMKATVKVQ